MKVLSILLQAVGSLGFILYGMKLMSEGIQKSAGESLHRILNMMTGNRFFAVLTGLAVTAIVQSSGATTVMTVSFVNAGMLSLTQAIGVIFGANIGTTVTAWIVALIGFQFKLAEIAIPAFGIGYFLTFFKKLRQESLGEGIMGFGLLFAGLGILSSLMPTISADNLSFLSFIAENGTLSILFGFFSGFFLTIILHSSSATTAIVLTMAYGHVIGMEFAAASVLGSNVGSTIDAVIAAIGSKLNARRTAAVHVLFNVCGALIFLILFKPALTLLYFLTPAGSGLEDITIRLALFHSLFNIVNTLIGLPFTTYIAQLVEWLVKAKPDDTPVRYQLVFHGGKQSKSNIEAYILQAEIEISAMSTLVQKMFDTICTLLGDSQKAPFEDALKTLAQKEDYADQMQEELSRYLIEISRESLSGKADHNVRLMLTIVDDLENMTDHIYELAMHLEKSMKKKMKLPKEDMDKLLPYIDIVKRFIRFVHEHLNKPLSSAHLMLADEMETTIDTMRTNLKKLARKRLEEGANVKAELLYIDIVRTIEKIGDSAFSISEALSKTL
ncbi:MAG: Na/Pi cotransporter family protein [Treponema sp.]